MLNKKEDINRLFDLSSGYLNNILKDEDVINEIESLYEYKSVKFVNSDVSFILFNEKSYLSNSYKIKIDILYKNKNIGHYDLYVDENEKFIDEFFVII